MNWVTHFYKGGRWIFDRHFYANDRKAAQRKATGVLKLVGPGWNCRLEVPGLAEPGECVYMIREYKQKLGRWRPSVLRTVDVKPPKGAEDKVN